MNLPIETFRFGKQYKEDEITQYFGDMDVLDYSGRENGKPVLIAQSGPVFWKFLKNHRGKLELAYAKDGSNGNE